MNCFAIKMCSRENSEGEREQHHFHFSSTELSEDFRELSENAIKDALNSLQEMLINKFPTDEEEIKNQIVILTELYLKKAEEPLQKFQDTAKEIFVLPSNILLPGYIEGEVVTPKELEQLKKEVEDLEKEYVEEIYYKAMLKRELEKFEQIKPLFEKVNEVLKFYKSYGPKPDEKSVQELFDVLKTCEQFYLNKIDNKQDKTKMQIADVFNLFKAD